ncbi:MAG TPA: hypothetical protein VEZ20_06695 [Allosphingosinicella sp.]|jgi:hypothetical protein|nr:hypothetical protein [Allosphingosinicella sp.]
MRAFLPLILLAGCGGTEEAQAPGNAGNAAASQAGPERVPSAAEIADMKAAAAALRAYYAAIGRGDHRAAWALREQRPGLDYARFARSFDIYADYRADVGTPSYPAEADGWVWIDAPVQTWGRRKDGERFGSVGRVLMKRRAGTGDWKIAP